MQQFTYHNSLIFETVSCSPDQLWPHCEAKHDLELLIFISAGIIPHASDLCNAGNWTQGFMCPRYSTHWVTSTARPFDKLFPYRLSLFYLHKCINILVYMMGLIYCIFSITYVLKHLHLILQWLVAFVVFCCHDAVSHTIEPSLGLMACPQSAFMEVLPFLRWMRHLIPCHTPCQKNCTEWHRRVWMTKLWSYSDLGRSARPSSSRALGELSLLSSSPLATCLEALSCFLFPFTSVDPSSESDNLTGPFHSDLHLRFSIMENPHGHWGSRRWNDFPVWG